MNKIKISAAFIFIVGLNVVTAHAQTISRVEVTETIVGELEFERGFAPISALKNKQPSDREFIAPKNSVETNSSGNAPSRQTYVRPTKKERFKRYASDAFGIPALIGATFGATVSQISNDPPEWGKNSGGFGKRYASSYATNAIRNSISYGLSETFKLDNRFEKSGQKNFGKRLKHVFLGSYTTRTRSGKRLPDFPFVTGTYAASIIANEAWYPERFNYRDGVRDGTISLGVRFGVNLLREFVFPK